MQPASVATDMARQMTRLAAGASEAGVFTTILSSWFRTKQSRMRTRRELTLLMPSDAWAHSAQCQLLVRSKVIITHSRNSWMITLVYLLLLRVTLDLKLVCLLLKQCLLTLLVP